MLNSELCSPEQICQDKDSEVGMKLYKPCASPFCRELAEQGSSYCNKHKPAEIRHNDYSYMYANTKWRALRKRILQEKVTCEICGVEATDVDHIKPHGGDKELFWDTSNLQALCHRCHSSKTANEINSRKRTSKSIYGQ